MVAYNFKSGFVPAIQLGRKCQTVRRHRKRHARPGEPVQLYTGMRTRSCRKLIDPDPICTRLDAITIDVGRQHPDCIGDIVVNGIPLDREQMAAFAFADGLRTVALFGRFWLATHGAGLFEGVVVHWEANRP